MFMASENLKQRIKDDREPNTAVASNNLGGKRGRRTVMAKRGLRSLSIAVAFPISLTLLNIYLFGSSHSHPEFNKPIWFVPLWLIHTACMASSFLMGLSAWLVWAEGGFHRDTKVLSLYLAQLGLSLAWYPIVLSFGATWVGLILCLTMVGALAGFSRISRAMNPIAGDLVKPCMVWAVFLCIVNLNLFLGQV